MTHQTQKSHIAAILGIKGLCHGTANATQTMLQYVNVNMSCQQGIQLALVCGTLDARLAFQRLLLSGTTQIWSEDAHSESLVNARRIWSWGSLVHLQKEWRPPQHS
jgi:hypothetical protein